MEESNSEGLPLGVGTVGEQASEAFALLGNETRLAILVALWEAYEPFETDSSLRFSELRSRVGTSDSGQFNYHLDRLEGHFVESTDGGYVLTAAGRRFVQSVIAGAGIEEPTLEPTEIATNCKLCSSAVEIAYDDGYVYNRCTECEGLWTDDQGRSDGHLSKFSLDPAGLANRSPNEIAAAAWVRSHQKLYTMLEGVCSTCSGRVERSLDVCEDHESDGVCPNCGRRRRIAAGVHCVVCKNSGRMSLGGVARYHPAVVAFYHKHGFDVQYGANDLGHIDRRLETGRSDVELLSAEPPRVRVTIWIDDDEIRLEIDGDLDVVAVEE